MSRRPRQASLEPDWSSIDGVELYSHIGDDGSCFDCFENDNVASDPVNAQIISQLRAVLRASPAADRPRPLRYVETLELWPLGDVQGEGETPHELS